MDTGVPSKAYTTTFVTGYLVNQINSWNKPNNHWVKRHLLTRVVSATAMTALAALDTIYNGTAATLKLPVATTKVTLGRLSIPGVGRLGDHITDRAGALAVLRHVYKTIVFAADMLIGPALGVVNPKWTVHFHHKTGIIHELMIIIPENDFNNDPEIYRYSEEPLDPLDFRESDMKHYLQITPVPDPILSSPTVDHDSLNHSIPWPNHDEVEVKPEPVNVEPIKEEPQPSSLTQVLKGAFWLTEEWLFKPLQMMDIT